MTENNQLLGLDTDAVFLHDGTKCVDCGGTNVAEPCELWTDTVVRCRDCGALT